MIIYQPFTEATAQAFDMEQKYFDNVQYQREDLKLHVSFWVYHGQAIKRSFECLVWRKECWNQFEGCSALILPESVEAMTFLPS